MARGTHQTHAGWDSGLLAAQIADAFKARRRRRQWARRLRVAGILLAGGGVVAGFAGLWWPAAMHWPLVAALIGVPALLLAATLAGE